MLLSISLLIFVLLLILIRLNRSYYILALCRRFRAIEGSPLEKTIIVIPGKTKFGNTFDILNFNTANVFQFLRRNVAYTKGKSYIIYFFFTPIYNNTTAEDAEEVLQSQVLLTKNILYEHLHQFLGEGLLTSTDEKWRFRRKILTPSFHFNILKSVLNIFKEESNKLVTVLTNFNDGLIPLSDVIPEFTLNNVCDTALGVKLSEISGNKEYRDSIHEIESTVATRTCNPLLYIPIAFRLLGDYERQTKALRIAHEFSSKIIKKKRKEFQKCQGTTVFDINKECRDVGQKKRFAMLDCLLKAKVLGQIDHQGICDEGNTFMFEGYDTTSTCLIFTLLNLGWFADIQAKCFEEIQHLGDAKNLTIFDYNKMEYLECVIKEILCLYPPVPFIGRKCMTEISFNGLVMPASSQISLHIYDIMRDPNHFPDPAQFDPSRFFPENTINRHPFAFIPFSAGPRNCIGQKFAILEIKVMLHAILKHFTIVPLIRLK